MKFKPSAELNLCITAATVVIGSMVLYFGPAGWLKWSILAALLLGGVLVETKIESAYLAQDKQKA